MGNYCCYEQNCDKKIVPKKKCCKLSSANNLSSKISEEKEILHLFNSQKTCQRKLEPSNSHPISHFQIICEIGKGGQAQVFKVKTQKSLQTSDGEEEIEENFYALKKIPKISTEEQLKSIKLGTSLLISHNCPFITKSYYCGENNNFIYEMMDIAEGGDLSFFLETTTGKGDKFRRLGQLGIKHVFAGIVLAIQYLHKENIIYNDLKLQNILIGNDGYPLLCDCHLILQQKYDSSNLHGTLIYLAPEILMNRNMTKGVDLWALGVLLYILMYEEEPFMREEIDHQFEEVCKKRQGKYRLKRKKISNQADDLINKLLKLNPKDRIGSSSIEQIKEHNFFHDWNWDKYYAKQLMSPLQQIVKQFPIRNKRNSEISGIQESSEMSEKETKRHNRRTKYDANLVSSQEY